MCQPPTIETKLFKDFRESRVDDEAENGPAPLSWGGGLKIGNWIGSTGGPPRAAS